MPFDVVGRWVIRCHVDVVGRWVIRCHFDVVGRWVIIGMCKHDHRGTKFSEGREYKVHQAS